jgi:tyrosyl-tRNA synthetase
MLTFLPLEEIDRLCNVEGEKINEAKKVLAYEITKIVHGEEEAQKAQSAAEALFGNGGNLDNMPTTKIEDVNISILDALVQTGIAPSKGQAKTLIAQGGVTLNDVKVEDIGYRLSEEDFKEGYAILKKGKKVFHKLEK